MYFSIKVSVSFIQGSAALKSHLIRCVCGNWILWVKKGRKGGEEKESLRETSGVFGAYIILSDI